MILKVATSFHKDLKLTETFMRKYFPVLVDVHQAALRKQSLNLTAVLSLEMLEIALGMQQFYVTRSLSI